VSVDSPCPIARAPGLDESPSVVAATTGFLLLERFGLDAGQAVENAVKAVPEAWSAGAIGGDVPAMVFFGRPESAGADGPRLPSPWWRLGS